MTADRIKGVLSAAILAEIERFRERFYAYTAQQLGSLAGLFTDVKLSAHDDTARLITHDDSVNAAKASSFTAEKVPGSIAAEETDTAAAARSVTLRAQKEIKDPPIAAGTVDLAGGTLRHSITNAVQSLIGSFTQQLTGQMKTAAENLAGELETSVEKLVVTHEKTTEIMPGSFFGITNNNRLSFTTPPQEVNIYMTAAQTDDKTAEAVRRKLEEFTHNAFGGDDFFSRIRPR